MRSVPRQGILYEERAHRRITMAQARKTKEAAKPAPPPMASEQAHDHGHHDHDHHEHDHRHEHSHEHVPTTTVKARKPNTNGIVEDGNVVVVHYTGTLDSGEQFDTSQGRDPIEFAVGSRNVIPGFETAIIGMKRGERKTIIIEAKEAYGDPHPELLQEVPREVLGDITPEPGMLLALHHPMAPQPIPVKVIAVADKAVTIDMNHPLAGQRLHFELEVVDIK
jgi:FKBP-type peptidyl-prolyl cis-trans isomerase 2